MIKRRRQVELRIGSSASRPDNSESEYRRVSVLIPWSMAEEMREVALKQERTMSWVIARAWERARKKIQSSPGIPGEPILRRRWGIKRSFSLPQP